ncbi:Mor transcription activator family protein [Pseudodesulfovibrio sp.]|uniref:Mor transcription activator family protein n=1 Tax=Pseudodesulfovibrio sp. TaxID=2035812 RepID=UPI0026259018|nr:Mor transcription activator family protein [Pseudodesulfovibrio sp.]MDD3310997.1 Mor transcription activator family protein [Pseudodesulfovibrio sp.]
MSNDTRKPATALLEDLADHLTAKAHQDLGIPRPQAKEFSEAAACYIADLWGGQLIYVPKDMASRINSRDSKIYGEFVGDNQAELARKFGLSFQHICRIIKKERAKRSVKQHNLPL